MATMARQCRISHSSLSRQLRVGLFRAEILAEITRLTQSSLELSESLEQLRWLQNGYKIRVALTDRPTIGIDTPDDLKAAIDYLKTLDRNA